MSTETIRFLRLRDVEHAVGLKRACIYQRISEGKFPKPVPLGDASNSPVGWIESEIKDWQLRRVEVRRTKSSR